MKLKSYYFLIFWVVVNSCKPTTQTESIFKLDATLASKVLIPSTSLNDPWKILSMDSLLIIGNKRGNTIIDVYNLNGKLLTKAGTRGREQRDIRMIGTMQPDYKNRCFYIYDLFEKKILKFDITALLGTKNYIPEILIDFKTTSSANEKFDKVIVFPGGYLAESKSSRGRLLLMDKTGKPVNYFHPFPAKIDKKMSDDENVHLYNSLLAISPDNRNFIMETNTAGIIDLFKTDSIKIKHRWSYNEFPPTHIKRITLEDHTTTLVAFSDSSKNGYQDLDVTNKFAFNLFSGKEMRDKQYNYCSQLRVIDWYTNNRREFQLDVPVNRIAVTQDNRKIFGLAKNQRNEPEIVVFNITPTL